MLAAAWELGVRTLDSAAVYGNAHEVIGSFHKANPDKRFGVVTKFLAESLRESGAEAALEAVLQELHVERLEGWMFHNPAQVADSDDVLDAMAALQQGGKIGRAGVSVYSNQQVLNAAADARLQMIQMPFNLLDNGHARAEALEAAQAAGMTVHIRSVFLQGLFFMQSLPEQLMPLDPALEQLRTLAAQHNLSLAQLAMAYPINHPQIDGVVVGTDNAEQLTANIELASTALPPELREAIEQIAVAQPELLNPSNWKR